MKFDFTPTKTYATEANAEKAADTLVNKMWSAIGACPARYMIVIDPNTNLYAPIFFNVNKNASFGWIAQAGFTVVN